MKQVVVQTNSEEVRKEAIFFGLPLYDETDDTPVVQINDKLDEMKVIGMATGENIILEFLDQEIIPLENIVAQLKGKTNVLVEVKRADKAKIAMETLEIGADGVVLETDDPLQLSKIVAYMQQSEKLSIEQATISVVKDLGLGARVCIDTCDLMDEGTGMLVGTSSQGMFLIQAEVEENPFVSPRPFRVNAGALSLYAFAPGNKTRYLEEIKAGDDVLIIDRDGNTRTTYVARSKIELRPLLLIEAKNDERVAKAVLQKAETVKLVSNGKSIAVTDIKVGDKVFVHLEEGGRHFGIHVMDEMVIEK